MADRYTPQDTWINSLFGPPIQVQQEIMQQRGADARQAAQLGAAASERSRQQQLLDAAQAEWNRIRSDIGRNADVTTPTGMDQALRQFAVSPQFMALSMAGYKTHDYVNTLRTLQTNPNAPISVAPGTTVGRDTPEGFRSEFRAPAAGEPGGPPGQPRAETSVDRERTKMLSEIVGSGQSAATQLQELERLVEPMARIGQVAPRGTWSGIAAKLGIQTPSGPDVTDLQIVQSIIEGLTPLQRRGLPGAASDRDMETFRGRLPQLMRTSEGNREILDFLIAQTQVQVDAARAAQSAFTDRNPGPDTSIAALISSQGIRFDDVLKAVRARNDATRDGIIANASGIDVSTIKAMNDAELAATARQLEARYGRGKIPPVILRKLQDRRDVLRQILGIGEQPLGD